MLRRVASLRAAPSKAAAVAASSSSASATTDASATTPSSSSSSEGWFSWLSNAATTAASTSPSTSSTSEEETISIKNTEASTSSSSDWSSWIMNAVTFDDSYFGGKVNPPVRTEAEIRAAMPPLWRPMKRYNYRKYVLSQYDWNNNDNQNNNTFTTTTAGLKKKSSASSTIEKATATAAASASGEQKPVVATADTLLRSVGLDLKTIFPVVAVYTSAFLVALITITQVFYFSLKFALGGAKPIDPRKRLNAKDSDYDDDLAPLCKSPTAAIPSLSPKQLTSRVSRELDENKLVILHSTGGCGKSTLLRRIAGELPDVGNNNSTIIYSNISPPSSSSSSSFSPDPITQVGQAYGISWPSLALSVCEILTKASSVFSKKERKPPTLFFDLQIPPPITTTRTGATAAVAPASLSSSVAAAAAAGGGTSSVSSSSSSSSSSHFNLTDFLIQCRHLCERGEYRIVVAVNTSLLFAEGAGCSSFLFHDRVANFEVREMSDRACLKLISLKTDVFAQSLIPFSKKTARFVRERLCRTIAQDQQQEEEEKVRSEKQQHEQEEKEKDTSPSSTSSSSSPSENNNPIAEARALVKSEYLRMEKSVNSVLGNCLEEAKLRALIHQEDGEVSWSDIEKYCPNKYSTNESFRAVAELREQVFTSTSTSSYRPSFEVVGEKIIPGFRFGEKTKAKNSPIIQQQDSKI